MLLSAISHLLLLLPPTSAAEETILGLYIFSRHGDRTSKSTPPTTLTDLGYAQVFASGSWFRNTYIANDSTSRIHGIADSIVETSQVTASAPLDNVLFPSALGFLQGLYPPVGSGLGKQTLRNGTTVEVPLNGYQLIPVATVTSGTGSEDDAWLQGSSNCANAIVSSNGYFSSMEYERLEESTRGFYRSLGPVIDSMFEAGHASFQNAYSSELILASMTRAIGLTLYLVYDYLSVAEIHNATISSMDLVTNDTLLQLRTLADTHEFNLAYKYVPVFNHNFPRDYYS